MADEMFKNEPIDGWKRVLYFIDPLSRRKYFRAYVYEGASAGKEIITDIWEKDGWIRVNFNSGSEAIIKKVVEEEEVD